MRVSVRLTILILVLSVTAWAADPPFVGKWKLNVTKSDFGESTVTYEQGANGEIKQISDGQSLADSALALPDWVGSSTSPCWGHCR